MKNDEKRPAEVRVLLVDDDASLGQILAAALRHHGFDVEAFHEGRSLLDAVAAGDRADVVILDVMMPGLDGLETCERLRATGSDVPVLFLSARDTPADKVVGLRAGGDDYLAKPFDLDELVARVEARLRGAHRAAPARVTRFADLVVDDDTHEVTRDGSPIELTSTEYRLLVYLLANAGKVVSKAQILDAVWHYDFDGDGSVVETFVYYLRRKIDVVDPKLIHTVRGVGYILRMPR